MKTIFFITVIFWFSMYPPHVSLAENKSVLAEHKKISLAVKAAEIHYLKVKNGVLLFQTKQVIDSVKVLLNSFK